MQQFARSIAWDVGRSVAASLGGWGKSYPADLALFWSSDKPLESLKGVDPTFTDVPTLSSGGVVPGDGPSFTDVIAWEDGGTLVVEFTATVASADLVGDVQVFGPLYAYSGGLKAMDGTNTSTWATSWVAAELVTAIVSVFDDGVRTMMRVVRGEDV